MYPQFLTRTMYRESNKGITKTLTKRFGLLEMEFKHLNSSNIVLCNVSGLYEFTSNTQLLEKLVQELSKHQSKKCLIDYRSADVILNVTVSFNRPNKFKELGIDNNTKGAVVFKKLTKESLFYENVCQNRGWNMRVFDNYETAMDWLK